MFKKLRNIARTGAAGVIIHGIIRLYCTTFRLKVENEAEWFFFADGISSFLPEFAFLKNIKNINLP